MNQTTESKQFVHDPLALERQICFKLYAASNLVTRMYRPLLNKLGITYPQYLVMLVLWESDPQTVSALGTRLYLDSGTLTPLLKRLEVAGLVVRRRDEEDERRVLIGLTEAGRALRESVCLIPETLRNNTPLTTAQLDSLSLSLAQLIAAQQTMPGD